MKSVEPIRVVMAAGGTGGHIYPALALAEALRARLPGVEVTFFCGSRPGELAIYRGQGIEPVVLPMTGRRPGIKNTLAFGRELAAAWRIAGRSIAAIKPAVAVGFGNYISIPVLAAASRNGAPTILHEQNAHPGLANRWLARRAARVLTGTPVPPGLFPPQRTLHTGNPVRANLLLPVDRAEARAALNLPPEGPICFCFGGSLGALGVNRMIMTMLENSSSKPLAEAQSFCESSNAIAPPWHFFWATGPTQFETVKSWLGTRPECDSRVKVLPYIDRMDLAYAAADLVLSRAGALTLAELTALGKASILVPLPTSAGDHQRANARALEQAGAAVVIEEGDPNAGGKLAGLLEDLANDAQRLGAMRDAALKLGRPNAGRDMAEAVAEVIEAER